MPRFLLFVPLMVFAVSVPLMMGIVPRNRWYGFRTPKTLSSDAVWFEANKIGGRYFVIAGVFQLIAITTGCMVWPTQANHLVLPYAGILILLPLLVAVALWFVRIRHI